MAYTKTQTRKILTDAIKSICDNVYGDLILPDVNAEANTEFPYVCLIDNEQIYQANMRLVSDYSLTIVGFVKGDMEDLVEKRDTLEEKTFWAIHNEKKLKVIIESINFRSVFRPWGLEAGVYFPYAAFRIEIRLPFVKRDPNNS